MANLVKNGNLDSPDITAPAVQGVIPSFWTFTGNGTGSSGMLDMNVNQTYSRVNLPSIITQCAFMEASSTLSTTLSQSITFSTSGNYVLSFWVNANYGYFFNVINTIQMTLGTTLSQNIKFPAANIGWIQYKFPFYINNSSQTLSFTSVCPNTTTNLWVSGVSIVSTDYTLDLYLEWIPDEEVEKNYKINRMIY